MPIVILAAGALSGCATANPQVGLTGMYELDDGPDIAGRLAIQPDGSFRYGLIAGALDETSRGRWQADGDAACLYTEPKPVPPAFSRLDIDKEAESGPTLLATWPNGEGIAGVDFRLGLDDGSVIEDYTQHDGWTMAGDDVRQVQWVELAIPMHRVKSPRFEISAGDRGPWRFVLTPNDLGVVDFQGTCLRREGSRYLLDREGGTMRFDRSGH